MKSNAWLMGGIVLVAVVLAGLLLAPRWVGTDSLVERIETQVAERLAVEVQVTGPVTLRLLPLPVLTLRDIEVYAEGTEIGSVARVFAEPAVLPLLAGRLQWRTLQVDGVALDIERREEGVFNVYRRPAEPGEFEPLVVRDLTLSDISVIFVDHPSGFEWRFDACGASAQRIRHDGGRLAQVMATLEGNAEAACDQVSQGDVRLRAVSMTGQAQDGIFDVQPIAGEMYDGELTAHLRMDWSSETPDFEAEGRLDDMTVSSMLDAFEQTGEAEGVLQLKVSLESRGGSWQAVRENLSGSLVLDAESLSIHGIDLDEALGGYAATQRFNLIDVGGVLLAGPLGLVASRGYSLTGLFGNAGERTEVVELVSEWTLVDGVAQASDVAFRTPETRLALSGGLDFVDYRIDDMTVAVLDAEGCAVMEQRIRGPFRDPDVERPDVLATVAGPVIDLLERGVDAVMGAECTPFYEGTVPHP